MDYRKARERRLQYPELAKAAEARHARKSGIPIRFVKSLPPAQSLQLDKSAFQEATEMYRFYARRFVPVLSEREAPGDPDQRWWDPDPGANGYTKA